MLPVTVYVFVAALQAPGEAVNPVMEQRMLQSVEPAPALPELVCETEILVL